MFVEVQNSVSETSQIPGDIYHPDAGPLSDVQWFLLVGKGATVNPVQSSTYLEGTIIHGFHF